MYENAQYLRKSSLILADDSGNAIDFSSLRISFKIERKDFSSPNSARIRVFNLSDNNANRIKNEFTKVILQAGYQSNYGVIFKGNIKETQKGRENSTDSFVDIAAGDGDEAYNFSYVSKTLQVGASKTDQINASIDAMTEYDVEKGYIADLGGQTLPRGKVLFGMSRRYLDQVGRSSETTWSIQNNQVNMIQKTSTLPESVVVLNNQTGVIQTPTVTTEGIKFSCLLNPLLKIGGRVRLNNDDILDKNIDEESGAHTLSADGVYRILSLEHSGDTFGPEWITNAICLDVDETASAGSEVSPL